MYVLGCAEGGDHAIEAEVELFCEVVGWVIEEGWWDAWEDLAYLGDGEKKRADESRIGYG